MPTDLERELFAVVEDVENAMSGNLGISGEGEPYYPEEIIPPFGDDPDEVVENAILRGRYLPAPGATVAGFSLLRGDRSYRVAIYPAR